MKTKFYCYADETGQDTRGKLFIVGIVIVQDHERESLVDACHVAEQRSGKGARKWTKSSHERCYKYTEILLKDSNFIGKLFVSTYHDEKNYVQATVEAISNAADSLAVHEFELTIYVDGLPRKMERNVGLYLRQRGVPAKKVRGARDENDALIRLADSVCGFVREAREGKSDWQALLKLSIQSGMLRELRKK